MASTLRALRPICGRNNYLADQQKKRRMFVNWAEQQLENYSDIYRKIIFSDEAHFWLNGFVNKHNMRYWSDSSTLECQWFVPTQS